MKARLVEEDYVSKEAGIKPGSTIDVTLHLGNNDFRSFYELVWVSDTDSLVDFYTYQLEFIEFTELWENLQCIRCLGDLLLRY